MGHGPSACPARHPGSHPPPTPVQVCIKRGGRYQPVDAARLDLGDHRATLTPPGGSPLVITTPMVAKATYDKAGVALVLVPSASGDQMLRDAEWKGWSVGRKSCVKALQPARPAGFKSPGGAGPGPAGLDSPEAHWPGTPSLTSVFGLIGWCGVVWCGVVWCGVVWCGVVWCGVVWCGVVWCGVVWCGVVWCGVVWCGLRCSAMRCDCLIQFLQWLPF